VDAAGLEGSYKIRCLVNGVDQAEEIIATVTPNLLSRIPAFTEEGVEYDAAGNAKGWHPAISKHMRATDAAVGSVPAHAASHQDGGGDEINVGGLSGTLADPQTPAAHTHTHASTTGKTTDDHHTEDHASRHLSGGGDALTLTDAEIAAANKDGVAGTASMRTLGTGAQQATAGNDSRLSDARTPTSHASSHQNAGGDTLAADVVKTTTGPTDMVVGAVADGQYLKRSGSTLVGDTPAGGTTAEALGTTGADVAVGTAAPPTAGQVLKASSPTVAAWADESGGGDVVAAMGAYIQVRLDTTMLTPVTGEPIEYDNVQEQRGELAYDAVNFKFTGLKAGRTYRLYANTNVITDAVDVQWYDLTNPGYLGHYSRVIAVNEGNNNSSTPVTEAIITPTEDTEVEVRMRTVSGTPDIQLVMTAASITEIGAVQANVIGGLEYMDTIEVGSDVTSVSFGAGGDGLLQRALDGDADEAYVLEYYLPDPVATVGYDVRPNGATSNLLSARWTAGGSTSGGPYGSMRFADLVSGRPSMGTMDFQAKSGKPRAFQAFDSMPVFGSTAYLDIFGGAWSDTSANITSLDLVASAANGIKTGARFVLWRRTRNNVRADSASTYERNVEATVAQGTNSEVEYTTGHATYQGSAIGLSVSLNDVVTAGSITVTLKVGGSTVLTAVLDTPDDTVFNRAIEAIGVHKIAPGEEIKVGIATSTLTTTGGGTPGITVNVTLVNDALIASIAGIIDSHNLYTKSQSVETEDLGNISGATAIDALASNTFKAVATAAAVIGAPSDMDDGYTIVLRVRQGGTGNYAITFNSVWDFGDDGPPDTSADAAGTLLLVTGSSDGTNVFAGWKKGYTNT
jgi:hypothetical protein